MNTNSIPELVQQLPVAWQQTHWPFLMLASAIVTHVAHQAWSFWSTVGGYDGLKNFFHTGRTTPDAPKPTP